MIKVNYKKAFKAKFVSETPNPSVFIFYGRCFSNYY